MGRIGSHGSGFGVDENGRFCENVKLYETDKNTNGRELRQAREVSKWKFKQTDTDIHSHESFDPSFGRYAGK